MAVCEWIFAAVTNYDHEIGGVAQLARAPALHAGGHRFESVRLHKRSSFKLLTDKFYL